MVNKSQSAIATQNAISAMANIDPDGRFLDDVKRNLGHANTRGDGEESWQTGMFHIQNIRSKYKFGDGHGKVAHRDEGTQGIYKEGMWS